MNAKPGRNDPCSCGSGKKYKQCCLKNSLPGGRRRFKATVLNAKGAIAQSEQGKKESNAALENGPDLIARTYAKKETSNEAFEAESSSNEALEKDSP